MARIASLADWLAALESSAGERLRRLELISVSWSELKRSYVEKSDAGSLERRCVSAVCVEAQLNALKRTTRWFGPILGSPLKGVIHHLT
jgi:hypothetical protein